MDKNKTLRIKEKLETFLKSIELEEEVIFSIKHFNNTNIDCSFEFSLKSKNDEVDKIETELCKSVGFTQNVIGEVFKHDGFDFIITEIRKRNRKYPVIAGRNGNNYKFTVSYIKRQLGGDKLINRNANLEKLLGDD